MKLDDIAKNKQTKEKTLTDMQLKSLQNILLMILDDVIEICEQNDLGFILIGGSAIGAVRNQGFIPWDDDVDIAMPRKDFEKFYRIVRKNYRSKYTMLHPQQKDNYGRVIPKIRLKGTEYRTILESDLKDCGIFLDIYTIENVFDSKALMLCQGMFSMLFGFFLNCRRIYQGRKHFRKYGTDFAFYIKCAVGWCLSPVSLETWARWTDFWYSVCKDEHTKRVVVPTDTKHFVGELYLRKNLCRYKEVYFEGRKCYLPVDYHNYLKGRYGDYMKLPPEEERVRNAYIRFDMGQYGCMEKETELC